MMGITKVVVKTEHLQDGWKFNNIIAPSRSDAAQHSTIIINGNKPIASCLSPDGLHIGVLPQKNRLLRDFFCFTNENAEGGMIAMDLGKVIPVAMVNSYSAHGPVGGTTWCNEFDGSRGPQVYTLYGNSAEFPGFENFAGSEWVMITKVDTRPDADIEDWQGTYGVNIKNEDGSLLGNFRWLVWDVKPTLKDGTTPEWTDTWYCELDVHTPETLINAGDAIMAGTGLESMVLAFKSHFDIGFTHTAPEIVDVYRTTMIDHALEIIEESYGLPPNQRFAWTIPSWVAYQILWDGQDPERRARVENAMRKGSLIVHGLPVTLQTESLEPDDLVFGLSLNRIISEKVGVPMSRSGKMTDVPSHSWILPSLLKNAGIDFLHIGVNPCSERPDVPLLYYWQGPDGSKLLTKHTQGYGSDAEFGHGLYPPKDWPYKTWLALIVATDNAAPPTKDELARFLDEAAKNMPNVNVRFGKMEDFADAIFAEEKLGAQIPVIRADQPDTWIHGFGSMPSEESLARNNRKKLMATGLLDFHLRAWNIPRDDISSSVFDARMGSLMYGEHTWGGNRNLEGRKAYDMTNFEEFIKTDKTAVWLENTWQYHADYIHLSKNITDSLERQAINQLAENVQMNGKRMVIYNPLPWKRDALVEIPSDDNRKMLVRDIPPSGYKTVSLDQNRNEYSNKPAIDNDGNKENTVIENSFLKLTIDRGLGGIVSILDKTNGRELVNQDAPYAFGQYLYERFDREQTQAYHIDCSHLNTVYGSNGRCVSGWNIRADLPGAPSYQTAVPEFQSMKVSSTATGKEVTLVARASGIIQSDVATTIFMPYDLPWFEVTVQLNNKKPDYWPEAGSIYFPVNAKNPGFRIGRLGSAANPATDFTQGSNRTYGYVNTGAMVADQTGSGLAFCPLDHGIMSFGEKGLCIIDPAFVPTEPIAKVSMFNNLWTINFPYWIKGTVLSRVRIWTVDNLDDSSLVVAATEARNPVLVGCAEGKPGKLPLEKTGIEHSNKGVMLFIENTKEEATILRVWEQTGSSGPLTITFPDEMKIKTAIPVDLRGTITGSPIEVTNNKLVHYVNAYAPLSFILK
jgi:hypothetical protein